MKTKEPHATEIRDAEIIAGAVVFTAFVQAGPFRRLRFEGETLEAAREAGREFSRETGKAALIYGVNAAGHATMIESVRA